MNGRIGWMVSSLVLAIAAAACGREPTGCDPCTTEAIVYGSLTGTQDAAASGRTLSIGAYAGGCDDVMRGHVEVMSDAQGRFRGRVWSTFGPFVADCISIIVSEPVGAPEVVRLVPVTLEFRPSFERPLDSIRVDVEL